MAPGRKTQKHKSQKAIPSKNTTLLQGRKVSQIIQSRRSARLESKVIEVTGPQQARPENTTKKRKHSSSDVDVDLSPPLKRSKQFFNSLQDNKSTQAASVAHWCRAKTWPKELFEMNPSHPRIQMLARPKLSRKRSNAGTAKSATNSDTASQDDKSNEYESKSYPRKLASEGFYMDPIGNKTPGPREDDLHQIGVWLGERPRKPLEQSPRQPSESRFDETHFRDTCLRINRQLEPRVVRDIGELIFPSPQFPSFPVKQDDPLADLVSELWTKAQRITLKPPKPDVSVGFDPEIAFTDVQRRKFYPYLGPVTYNSQFAATEAVVFPFIACETKKAGGTVDWADNQNAHSMFIAVRSIVCLYTLLGKDTKDLHQKVLAFSVSHSNDEVRIHVYYPITKDVTRIRYHRHEIKKYFFQADNGRERWLAFRFVASVYSDWAPNHLKEICNLLDELPLPAQSTGLSQRLEASSVGTDLDDLQLEPCPDNIAHGSSETLLSTTTAQVKENVAAPQDGPRKVSKQRQRKN